MGMSDEGPVDGDAAVLCYQTTAWPRAARSAAGAAAVERVDADEGRAEDDGVLLMSQIVAHRTVSVPSHVRLRAGVKDQLWGVPPDLYSLAYPAELVKRGNSW